MNPIDEKSKDAWTLPEALSLGEIRVPVANWRELANREGRYRDLSDIAGSWKEDPEFDRAIADLDVIDPDL